jgi:ankyrin repeat protein
MMMKRDHVFSQFQNERLLLHWAAVGGHVPIVTLLLEGGSPVDGCDDVITFKTKLTKIPL